LLARLGALYSTVYRPENTQNGRIILLIANLMADSDSGSPDSYLSFLVTIRLSRLILEIFACDTQMDNVDHIVAGQLIICMCLFWHKAVTSKAEQSEITEESVKLIVCVIN